MHDQKTLTGYGNSLVMNAFIVCSWKKDKGKGKEYGKKTIRCFRQRYVSVLPFVLDNQIYSQATFFIKYERNGVLKTIQWEFNNIRLFFTVFSQNGRHVVVQ